MQNHDENQSPANTWVVVAEVGSAVIYTRSKLYGKLETVTVFDEPTASLGENDLDDDAPAHASGRADKESQLVVFSSRIADEIETARKEGRFSRLVIIAAPKMLGQLRAHLSNATATMLMAEFNKHLRRHDPEAIAKLLEAQL